MDNILYLDDYINLYNRKTKQLIIIKPYKNTLQNGFVIDKDKFIKRWNLVIEKYGIKNSIFDEMMFIVTNNLYNIKEKIFIKELMENLNYKHIKFIQETNYLKINKEMVYINYNYTYFYLLYTDYLGNIEYNLYKNDSINKSLILKILDKFRGKKIIIYGKNYKELENILKTTKKDYYYFEETENLLIKILVDEK